MKYRLDIDGLRALAVVAVVAVHIGLPGWQGGFVGVDVFFAISGFLISTLLLDECARMGAISFMGFYARRMRRILPALAVVVSATALAAAWLLNPIEHQKAVMQSAAASALFVANLFFWRTTGGYFDYDAESLSLLHMWSLGVEEQWYLVFPALLVGLLSVLGRFGKAEHHGRKRFGDIFGKFRRELLRIQGAQIGRTSLRHPLHMTWPHRVRIGDRCQFKHNVTLKVDGIYASGLAIDIGNRVFGHIAQVVKHACGQVRHSVNSAMVASHWEIGRLMVEHEQQGQLRAAYGQRQLAELSIRLTKMFGKGFDASRLRYMRLFYKAFQIRGAVRHELGWTHYRVLRGILQLCAAVMPGAYIVLIAVKKFSVAWFFGFSLG